MLRFEPRVELAVMRPVSSERSFDAVAKEPDLSTVPLLRASEDWERALSVPDGFVVSICLLSSGFLVMDSVVPPGWNVLAAGIDWLETG